MTSRRTPSPFVAFVAFLALLLSFFVATDAWAFEVRGAKTDFELSVAESGARVVCPLKPLPAVVSSQCAPVVAASNMKLVESTLGTVELGFDEWFVIVGATETAASGETRPTDAELDRLAKVISKQGRSQGFDLHGEAPGTLYDVKEISGARAMRMIWEGPALKNEVLFETSIFADGGTVNVIFRGPASHVDDILAFENRTLATVHVRPLPAPSATKALDRLFTAPGAGAGLGLGVVGLFVVIAAGIAWWRSESKLTSPQRAAKASWLTVLVLVAICWMTSTVKQGSLTFYAALSVVGLGVILVGVSCGAFALAKVRSHGTVGVLKPALVGTLLHLTLFGLAAWGFVRAAYRR